MSTSSANLSKCWAFIRIFGTPTLGAILQRSVGKHPEGIRLGNSHDHGAYP
jgi:hypothetical protein